jgi:hypothetical protein
VIDLYRTGKAVTATMRTYLTTKGTRLDVKIIEQCGGTGCEWWDGDPQDATLTASAHPPRCVAFTAGNNGYAADRIYCQPNERFVFYNGVFIIPAGTANYAVYTMGNPVGNQGS